MHTFKEVWLQILQIAKLLGLKNAKVGGANRSALTGDLGQAAILIVQAAITVCCTCIILSVIIINGFSAFRIP